MTAFQIQYSNFSGNAAHVHDSQAWTFTVGGGGAILSFTQPVEIGASHFEGNIAIARNLAAIFHPSVLLLDHHQVGNRFGGGALYGNHFEVQNCFFMHNSAHLSNLTAVEAIAALNFVGGGAVFSNVLNSFGSEFWFNAVESSSLSVNAPLGFNEVAGGAACALTMRAVDTLFSNNMNAAVNVVNIGPKSQSSAGGGAVFSNSFSGENNDFRMNMVMYSGQGTLGSGGGLLACFFSVHSTNFSQNSATFGGGLGARCVSLQFVANITSNHLSTSLFYNNT